MVEKMTEKQTKLIPDDSTNPDIQPDKISYLPGPLFYGQRWDLYYLARRSEKLFFIHVINNVIDAMEIKEEYCGNGRPPAKIRDILKALCIKVYTGQSSWCIESELKIAKQLGVIQRVYKKSCLNKYLNDSRLTLLLDRIYKTIAEPIAEIEETIAIDSTGISDMYGRRKWVDIRLEHQLHKKYLKLHILCGTNTNIICSAMVTDGNAGDHPMFEKLLAEMKTWKPKEIVADSAYLSRKNANLAKELGMKPYILPKKNTGSRFIGLSSWGSMIRLFKEHELLFRVHYHQRSNVESTFSTLKRRFFDYVRAKGRTGQVNEILCKVICLNAVLLAQAVLIFDEVKPEFMDGFINKANSL